MTYKNVIEGIENGSISIEYNGHTIDLLEYMNRKYNHWVNVAEDYRKKIKNNEPQTDNVTHADMLSFFENLYINRDIKIGHHVNIDGGEYRCDGCGMPLYPVLLEGSIFLMHYAHYSDVRRKSGVKPGEFFFKREDCEGEKCDLYDIMIAKKLTSIINVNTGKLVFKNHFDTECLYCDPNNKYGSINYIVGRNKLMQYLATQNVGYGQMGNMSITIFSNEKDEILIGREGDYVYENLRYYEQHPEAFGEEEKKEYEVLKVKCDEFNTYLKTGKFKKIGEISLGVWRWMCADKSVLDLHGETIKKHDHVIANVIAGKYLIEHYYDLQRSEEFVYSKIKLIIE